MVTGATMTQNSTVRKNVKPPTYFLKTIEIFLEFYFLLNKAKLCEINNRAVLCRKK